MPAYCRPFEPAGLRRSPSAVVHHRAGALKELQQLRRGKGGSTCCASCPPDRRSHVRTGIGTERRAHGRAHGVAQAPRPRPLDTAPVHRPSSGQHRSSDLRPPCYPSPVLPCSDRLAGTVRGRRARRRWREGPERGGRCVHRRSSCLARARTDGPDSCALLDPSMCMIALVSGPRLGLSLL